jgi:hypothetical protein
VAPGTDSLIARTCTRWQIVSVTALGLLAFDQTLLQVSLGFVAVFSIHFAFSG